VKVLFCTSNLPGAAIIRAVTWSKWSHVALIDGDEVIEAVWPEVRVASLDDVIKNHSSHCVVDIPCESTERIISAARSQIGKGYDLTALFGLFVKREWQEPDKWFCSELVAWAFSEGGTPLFRAETMHRVTPQNLWMICK
jgi:hypothetical protein